MVDCTHLLKNKIAQQAYLNLLPFSNKYLFSLQDKYNHLRQYLLIITQWKKPIGNFIQQDGFIIKLPKSNEEIGISVKFSLISNPPKFQVESSLQRIVGMKKGTRIAILDAFWQYVKDNKLQDI